MPPQLRDCPFSSMLFSDLYELLMAQAYAAEGMDGEAVFEVSFRRMPDKRNYLLAAGLDDVLYFLENWRASESELAYLHGLGLFSEVFLDRLKNLRFQGDVYAMPEGTVVFPNEPLVQIVAPIMEAQLAETYVLNQVHFQTAVASKASRIVSAAANRTVVDFGSRRAHGVDAALKVARASYLAGAAGTSLLLAGQVYGIPVFGTMAHSYIQAHGNETEAFEAFARLYPNTTLLVDTYGTLEGVQNVIALSRRLGAQFKVRAVRLDSGSFKDLARQTRLMLDNAGLNEVGIFASTELDEYELSALVADGAPIDGFGLGTRLAVVEDAPSLDMAYKLVEYAGRGRIKLSPGKIVYPHRKQVFRSSAAGKFVNDMVGRWDEHLEGRPLLEQAMKSGVRLPAGCASLKDARLRMQREVQCLPDFRRGLEAAEKPYPVQFSKILEASLESLRLSNERRLSPNSII